VPYRVKGQPVTKDIWDILGIVVIPVTVALIASGIPAVVQGRKFRDQNSTQHQSVSAQLTHIGTSLKNLDEKIERVETKVDQHIGRHQETERLKAAGRSW
jgi:peptidoglycan hydrolase CwlO-like protein